MPEINDRQILKGLYINSSGVKQAGNEIRAEFARMLIQAKRSSKLTELEYLWPHASLYSLDVNLGSEISCSLRAATEQTI